MRKCIDCNQDFKMYAKVNGKSVNLSGRKRCLKCKPYGKVPEAKKKNNSPYSSWSYEKKQEYIKRYQERGEERKKKLVELKGGGCQTCGYSKCSRVLTFHHRDPKTKSFCLTVRELSGFSWETVLAEANKCDLLCLNCHMELEDTIQKSKDK